VFVGFVDCVLGQASTDRERDGFLGKVKQINLAIENFSETSFEWVKEDKDVITIYDINGNRTFETKEDEPKIKELNTLVTIRLARANSIFDFSKKGETVVKESKNKDGKVIETRVFTYDRYGFCTNFVLSNIKGVKKERFSEYQYDNYGNWTKQVCYRFDKKENSFIPVVKYTRTVYYY